MGKHSPSGQPGSTTERPRDDDSVNSGTTQPWLSEYESDVDDVVENIQRGDEIEETLEEYSDGDSPYRGVWDEDTPDEAIADSDADTAETAQVADSADEDIPESATDGERVPGDDISRSVSSRDEVGMGVARETDLVDQDMRSHVDGGEVQPEVVGVTREGDQLVATAPGTEVGGANAGVAPSQGTHADPSDLTTDAGGVEHEMVEGAGMTAQSAAASASVGQGLENDMASQAGQALNQVQTKGGYVEQDGDLYETHETPEGPVESRTLPQRRIEGAHTTTVIDRDATPRATEEMIVSRKEDFEEMQERAIEKENEMPNREAGFREANSRSTDRAEKRQEWTELARRTLAPSRISPDGHTVEPDTSIGDIQMLTPQGAQQAQDALNADTAGDLVGISESDIKSQTSVSDRDAKVLARAGTLLEQRGSQINAEAQRLANSHAGEFDAGDYQDVIERGVEDGYTVEQMTDYLDSDDARGHIPGATLNDASSSRPPAPPITELEPLYDSSGNHVTAPHATVQGEVVEVIDPETVENDWGSDQYQAAWVEDDYGNYTIVTVFKDSIEFPESNVDPGNATRTGGSPYDDLGTEGILHGDDTLREGDYVRLEGVRVNEEGHSQTDGHTLSTVPSTEVKFYGRGDIPDGKPPIEVAEENSTSAPKPPTVAEYKGETRNRREKTSSPSGPTIDPRDIALGSDDDSSNGSIFVSIKEALAEQGYDTSEFSSL